MGVVYLVGAGPGDPGLVTIRAAELIRRADVLVYDALVNPRILEWRRAGAELIYVGKRGGTLSRTQDEINAILLDLASQHACTVRLKGGDPFIFGRGGEEALVLVEAGVPFEVVPGITAGVAAAAYAGIPITQRGMTSSVAFVTGHEEPLKNETDVDWTHLANGVGTVVFYMGVGRMEQNFRCLIDAGRSSSTPAAVVEWGCYPRQRTVTGTLSTLPAEASAAGIGAPAIVIVGDVVTLRDKLTWYDRRPLSGKRVIVTRARAQASAFAAQLEELGAEVIEFPTVRTVAPDDPAPLQAAVSASSTYDWIVFSSVNGVVAFWQALAALGRDTRSLGAARICAVGSTTAGALQERGVTADVVPAEFVAEGVAEALAGDDLKGKKVLLPRADGAREVLPELLATNGAVVTPVVAYRTIQEVGDAADVRRQLTAGEIDLITFTAASTVRNFVQLAGAEIGDARVASIGPITSAAARELGLAVDIEAAEYTVTGLLAAIRAEYEAE